MLAQRWEKPSTAQEERRAITRARRLCKRKKRAAKSKNQNASSDKNIPPPAATHRQDLDQTRQRFNDGRTFLSASSQFGMKSNVIAGLLSALSQNLVQSIALAEDTVASIQSISSFPLPAFSELVVTLDSACMMLAIRWDPDTMKRTAVKATTGFCSNIAGMSDEEFCSRMDSGELSKPCTSIQLLNYFVDGALCIGQGVHSWIRYDKYPVPLIANNDKPS